MMTQMQIRRIYSKYGCIRGLHIGYNHRNAAAYGNYRFEKDFQATRTANYVT